MVVVERLPGLRQNPREVLPRYPSLKHPHLRFLASGIYECHLHSQGRAPSSSPLCHTQSGMSHQQGIL